MSRARRAAVRVRGLWLPFSHGSSLVGFLAAAPTLSSLAQPRDRRVVVVPVYHRIVGARGPCRPPCALRSGCCRTALAAVAPMSSPRRSGCSGSRPPTTPGGGHGWPRSPSEDAWWILATFGLRPLHFPDGPGAVPRWRWVPRGGGRGRRRHPGSTKRSRTCPSSSQAPLRHLDRPFGPPPLWWEVFALVAFVLMLLLLAACTISLDQAEQRVQRHPIPAPPRAT